MRPTKALITIALGVMLCCCMVLADTYYVSPTGSDDDAGTADHPWVSLEHAAAQASPGDTVILTPGEYPGELRPVNSGEKEAPIIFRAEPRRQAVLTGVEDVEDAYAVVLSGLSDIHLDGLVVRPEKRRGRWVRIHQCERIVLEDMLMEDIDNSLGLRVTESSDFRLLGSDLRLARRGSMARIEECDRVVIEGCSFSRGAHDTFLVWPDRTNSRLVIRGNVFHPNTCRPLLIDAVDRVLFEDNIIVRSNDGGRSGSSRFAFDTKDSIFRHNRIYANWGSNLLLAGFFRDTLDFRRIRFYNNIFDDNTAMATNLRGATQMIENCIFANNAFSGNDKHGEDRQVLVQSGTSDDLVFISNLIHGNVQFEDKVFSPAEAEDVSDGVFIDNMNTNPGYRDAATYDYRPAPGSPMIDAGRTFTQATQAGTGTALQVDDSRWFYDGFGIEGEWGDEIVVGTERQRARIESIDHEQSVLHLDRELNWEAGAHVSLPFSGEAPDIGAYETGGDGRPSVQIIADPVRTSPGESIKLEAVMHGTTKPQSIHWILGDGTVAQGQSVTHTYDQPYDYPIRVTVTDTEGLRHWGASFVLVEEPRPDDAPLVHNTFGESDEDAWWQWMCYRPLPSAHEYLNEGPTDNGSLHVYAREDGYFLGAQTQPTRWNLDKYPHVMIRYKIAPGTPVVLRVFAFGTSDGSRGIRLTQTESTGLSDSRLPLLVDDGEWHEISFNAAHLLRKRFGDDLKMGKLMYLRESNTDLVEAGDEYWLDEVIIGALP